MSLLSQRSRRLWPSFLHIPRGKTLGSALYVGGLPLCLSLMAVLPAGCNPGTSTAQAGQEDNQNGQDGQNGQNGQDGDNGQDGETPSDVQSLIDFYEPQSMLFQAREYTDLVDGDPAQWSGPYMEPEPELFTDAAAEFLTIYPRSVIPAPGESVLGTLADQQLWEAINQLGITLMHPVAIEQAGQVTGREVSPSVDGGFDRISLEIEPMMGTEEDVHDLVQIASDYDAIIAGDIIPLHTGLGYDFRLATMNYQNYPGIYDMVEVPEEMWGMLPAVDDEWGFQILTNDEITPFIDEGIVPGRFDVLLGQEESTNWSGWAATSVVTGADGQDRRWLYAHLFKPEQPAINWMDPTYNGRLTQSGDIVRHVVDLGMTVNRLDAVPFIGLEPQRDSPDIDVFTTQLAIMGTNELAFTHRKLGGWTWVELNVVADEYLRYLENGPDLGYDFITRAQTVHPLINGDARVLRVAHRTLLDSEIPHSRLIHAMQNHDEIAYQLIPLRAQEEVQYGDETLSGSELADRILSEAQEATTGENAPYNALYRPAQDGIATTYAGFIAPALGIDPYNASDDEVETIKQAHVLLAQVNAMQPGVFAISQWDLRGALPLDRDLVRDRIEAGDFRWLNRGAVDLMGVAEATESPFGLPEAQTLYPPLPEQLGDESSFASQVADIITARKRFRISDATVVDVPNLEDQGLFVLVMTLPDEVGGVAVTVANYSQEQATATVDLSPALDSPSQIEGDFPFDIIAEERAGSVEGTTLTLPVDGLTARTVVIAADAVEIGGNGSGNGSGN